MKAAIHQPLYFPYPGFFHKISLADVFVIMDDVQYDKRFTNRNRILVPQGPIWLTVPIQKKDKFSLNMSVEINNSIPWGEDHLKKIRISYTNSPYYGMYRDYFESTFTRQWKMLFELDYDAIRQVMTWLDLNIPVIRESELKVQGESTERLINVCKAVGADTYVSGIGGRNYMDEGLFQRNGVRLEYQNYVQRPYPQRFSDVFVPDLSIIDMLCNIGPRSMKQIAGDEA